MKDIVLQSNLNSFASEFALSHLSESEQFEHFSNYCILSRVVDGAIDIFDVWYGQDNAYGIDGAAIIVNENVVSATDEVDALVERFRHLDAHYVFIQSKTSEKFEAGDILKLFDAVDDFFSDEPQRLVSRSLQKLHALSTHIYNNPGKMRRSPSLSMYYATSGNWKDDKTLRSLINKNKKGLSSSNRFDSVDFFAIDRAKLIDFYRQLKLRIIKTISFSRHITIPLIQGVKEAFVGILRCEEYIKLISSEDGFIQRSLFYDNVRDYQGLNRVNSEIRDTLLTKERKDRFPLLNNGITIVAKSIRRTGDQFTLEDFQIVNGCQTSHVLHSNKSNINQSTSVVIKLIATENPDIAIDIIRATNWQTEVKNEAFASLEPFHKLLEQYYDANPGPERLYYERRSKQYESEDIEKNRIIKFATQIKCVLAVMLEEPHSTHRYYGELLTSYSGRIFVDTHSCAPYYVSGLCLFFVERLFRNNDLNRSLRPFRFHLIMVVRILVCGERASSLVAGKDIEQFCAALKACLVDENVARELFFKASQIIEDVLSREGDFEGEADRRRDFTQKLLKRARLEVPVKPLKVIESSPDYFVGELLWYNEERGFGFIQRPGSERDIFFHVSGCKVKPSELLDGVRLKYQVRSTKRGQEAYEVVKM